jgi:nicotinate-nucleotide adenylyltransferase
LAIAEWARDQLRLDRVLFVPAGQPPHKSVRASSPAVHRTAMTRLATRGHDAFAISTVEIRRDGPSFTVDTLRWLRRRHPESCLFLILGGDSLDDFSTWRQPQEITRLATLVIAARDKNAGGARKPRRQEFGLPARRVIRLDNPPIGISSSLIRRRVRQARSIRYLVTDAVARYIERHRLYGPAGRRQR